MGLKSPLPLLNGFILKKFNPNPHGPFSSDFSQSDNSAADGLIFKKMLSLKDFLKLLPKMVERTS